MRKILFLLIFNFLYCLTCFAQNTYKEKINPKFEKNIIYDPLPEFYRANYKNLENTSVDHWFWKKIKKDTKENFEFTIAGDSTELEIAVNIYTLGKKDTKHLILFYLNDNYLGSLSGEGNKENTFHSKISEDMLKRGRNILSVRTAQDIYLNWFEIARVLPTSFEDFFGNDFKKPYKIVKDIPSSLKSTDNSCEYLIITLDKFKKDILKLAKYRSKKYKVKIVDVQDIYDEFNFGNFSPEAIKDFLKYAYNNWSEPKIKYVLLIGDATVDVDWIKDDVIPVKTIKTLVGGDTGTDNWFVDFDDDSIPELAIGRLPVNTRGELKMVIDKIINYEQDKNISDWRKRISFFTADEETIPENMLSLVEKESFKIFNAMVSYDFDVSATLGYRGSPYNYITEKFPQKFADRINEGVFTFVYFGHGDINWLGPVLKGKKKYPVFESRNISLIKNKNMPPIMILICCLVGGFDWPGESTLSEKLLLNKYGGVAVIASSRISDPYGNAIILKEILQAIYKDKPSTVGEAIIIAKRNLIEANDFWRQKIDGFAEVAFDYMAADYPELKESKELYIKLSKEYHNHLYNLLGDPATEINYPEREILFDTTKRARKGEIIEIKGGTKNINFGQIKITLEAERDKIIYPQEVVDYTKQNWQKVQENNYHNANNKIVWQKIENIKDNKFTSKIIIPENLPEGKYIIKGYANDGKMDAVGHQVIIIK